MDENQIQLVKEIRELDQQASTYLIKLPSLIDTFIIDNEYANCQSRIQSILMQSIFGEVYDDICWFLYEWQPGYTIEVLGGTVYILNTEEDYYNYLRKEYVN